MTLALRADDTPAPSRWHWHRWGPARIHTRDGINASWDDQGRGRIRPVRVTTQARRCRRCDAVELIRSWDGGWHRSVTR